MTIPKIGETIQLKEFEELYPAGTTISADEFNKKYPSVSEKQDYSGLGSSIVNFGKSLAQVAYLKTGGQKEIDRISKGYLDEGDKLFQLAQKQTEPERKKQLLLQAQNVYKQGENITTDIIGRIRTNKQIVADALGTLGWTLSGGTPTFKALGTGLTKSVSTVGSRLAMGTVFGAGAGAQRASSEEKSAGEIAKSTVIGAGVGLAVSGAFEGATMAIKRLFNPGKLYNRELQPNTKDMVNDFKRHVETLGEEVANATDDTGKVIYKGGYKTMATQGENQIKKNVALIRKPLQYLDKTKPITIKAQGFKKPLLEKLTDEFGYLDDRQLATVEAEIKRLPIKMSRISLLENRQIVDSKIPRNFWIDPSPQRAFVGNIRYYLRGLMKIAIEDSAPGEIVRQLNKKIGLASEVRDLSYLQQVLREKGRGVSSIGFWKPIAYLLDRTIFSPQVTTRVAQSVKNIGKLPNVIRTGLTTGITNMPE